MTIDKLTKITCTDEANNPVLVDLFRGDVYKGIGYLDGEPVMIYAGKLRPGAKMSEKSVWIDLVGRCFSVNELSVWEKIDSLYGQNEDWTLC